MDIIPEFN